MANNNKNKSILEEAVIELQSIVEASDKSAKDRMAKQLPEQFEKILKEELDKNKKESVKESVKDETKEPVIEGEEKTDSDKESLNEMNEIDLRELSIEDIESAYNGAGDSDEFEVSSDDVDLEGIDAELGEMENMAGVADQTMQEEGENPNDPFDKIKNLHKMLGEMIQDNEQTNEMHEVEPRGATAPVETGHNTTPQGINEVLEPEMVGAIWGIVGSVVGAPLLAFILHKIKQKNPELAKSIENIGSAASGSITGGGATSNAGGGIGESEDEEEVLDEVDTVEDKEAVDEIHGQSFSSGKVRAGSLPNDGAEYRDRKGHSRNRPQWSNESVEKFITQKENMEKRMTGLINESKKVTKKLNETKSENKKFEGLSADQKKLSEALVKYRNQLSEMAVFNTNLANVNNILVNESLALTIEDKKDLINKFKDVKSIVESENTYKTVLNEMEGSKKTITESIEDKVNDAIEPSAQKTEKIVEQTAFKNEHVDKIKSLMNYVDNHGNKKILS
jgi:hypothetical protein